MQGKYSARSIQYFVWTAETPGDQCKFLHDGNAAGADFCDHQPVLRGNDEFLLCILALMNYDKKVCSSYIERYSQQMQEGKAAASGASGIWRGCIKRDRNDASDGDRARAERREAGHLTRVLSAEKEPLAIINEQLIPAWMSSEKGLKKEQSFSHSF